MWRKDINKLKVLCLKMLYIGCFFITLYGPLDDIQKSAVSGRPNDQSLGVKPKCSVAFWFLLKCSGNLRLGKNRRY